MTHDVILVPRRPSPDDALSDFLDWVGRRGLTLWPHQEAAILELWDGRHVVLDAPTGSGKSLVATALSWKALASGQRAFWTAPVKALVTEKFFDLCTIFGPERVGMMTGDGSVHREADLIVCTTEVLANLALRDASARIGAAALDEFHYYADRDRGTAWQLPLLTLRDTQFLLMSATLGDTSAIRRRLEAETGRAVAEVAGTHRPVPLSHHYSEQPLLDTLTELVRTGRAPVYVVHFAQNDAADLAQSLMSTDWCTKSDKAALSEALKGAVFPSPFGATMRRFLLHGIGLHHGGLLPRYRRLCERLAQRGLLKVICGTDTLGVGINVPIRTVLFTQLCKFDGETVDILKVRDFRQIAGRAGRAGFDTEGHVVVQAPEHVVTNLKLEAKADGDPKKLRKLVRAQPPARGYKHWDRSTWERLRDAPPEPLEPVFAIDHARLLAAMQSASDRGEPASFGWDHVRDLLRRSHLPDPQKAVLEAHGERLLASLYESGVLAGDPPRLSPDLPREFSLDRTLSLMLVDAVRAIDREAPDRARRILAWIEATLDPPRAVLLKQQDRARAERLAELKAQGVPYEERIEILETVSWPKPYADAMWGFFDDYRASRPWLASATVRPCAIAAAFLDGGASFAEFIRDGKFERLEGVVLRYLGDVGRALFRGLPDDVRDDTIIEWTETLRATLSRVDSSLLDEWTALRDGGTAAPDAVPTKPWDRRAALARLRAEVHALIDALSRGDWDEAATCLRGDVAETATRLEDGLGGFLRAHGVAWDHAARLPSHCAIREPEPRRFQIRQTLLPRDHRDHDGDGLDVEVAAVELTADLREPGEGVRIELVAIDG